MPSICPRMSLRWIRPVAGLFSCILAAHAASDRKLEDAVANLFVQIRADAKLPRLTRIEHSIQVEQLTCTAASRDASRFADLLLYKTEDPFTAPAGLRRLAIKKWPRGEVTPTRFAVAVWPAHTPDAGQPQYWVGVKLYLSPIWEFLTYTMTDDIGHRNDWKRGVSADCNKVH